MAPMVPEPVGAGIPGLIKPVRLLLAQVIRFRDQKQNTINPQDGCRGRPSGSHAKIPEWAPQLQAITRSPAHPPTTRNQGAGGTGKVSLQQGPLDKMPDQTLLGHLGSQGLTGRQAPQVLSIC